MNPIALQNFKKYLVSKICTAIYNQEWDLTDINLFSNDMSIVPTKIIQAKGGEKIYNWDKLVITDKMVENQEFEMRMVFDTLSLPDSSISFKTLKKLSENFNTEDIKVSGDGKDYQYSEYTSNHESEVILTIIPKNPQKLIEESLAWNNSLELQKKSKNKMK